jgi:uncharacterized caspase-like protein
MAVDEVVINSGEHSMSWYAMVQKAITCAIFEFLIVALLCLGSRSVIAQQKNVEDFEQRYATEVSKARAECSRLWSNHDFDPFRTKLNLGEEKPTFSMLKSTEKLNRKEKPLADLAIKTLEQCRKAYEPVYAMLPPQIKTRIEAIQRGQDAKVAELYNGRITFGDFNGAISRMAAEAVTVFSGILQSPGVDVVANISESSKTIAPSASVENKYVPTELRVALVIGNSTYVNLPKLSNPANDANAVAEILKAMGYKARLLIDGSEQSIRREIRQFASDSEKADVAFVFYAGHGAQVNGNNYLLPTDIDIPRTEVDIQFSGLKVDDLVNSIRSNTKIVFLDACRDNPALFKNLVKGRGSSPAGLAPAASSNFEQRPGGGIFIAYATDAGAVADDGNGKHSPFTQALLRNMQKPISIDDMFSLVTKEVRLVTKNAQRPYKYASLENIICVAPNCSNSSNPVSVGPVEQAQRSETDELQVAKTTNKVAALETFLEKYPETPKRLEVQNLIRDMRRTEFTEWTLYEIGNKRIPWFLRLSSIQQLQDRVAVKMRFLIDPESKKVFFGRPIPDAEYIEQVAVYDCVKHTSADSEDTILGSSNNTLYHYKFADPRYLDLSIGQAIVPGSVSYSILRLVCNDELRTPTVSKTELSEMSFKSLSSTVAGDGDIFYEPLPNNSGTENQKELLFVMRYLQDRLFALAPGTSIPDVPSYRTEVDKVKMECIEKRMLATKSEFYSVSGELVSLTAPDPDNPNPNWIKIDNTAQTPLSSLYRIFCNSGEATK